MATSNLNTGSILGTNISTTLSTQIIIKVGKKAVGGIQGITIAQDRPLKRIPEIGVDGFVEIVPMSAATFTATGTRIIFDHQKTPEAFARSFNNIHSQRIPFEIDIIDRSLSGDAGAPLDNGQDNAAFATSLNDSKTVIHTLEECWFQNLGTPFSATDYTVIESFTIWARNLKTILGGNAGSAVGIGERGYSDGAEGTSIATADNVETSVDIGRRIGSLDAAGLAQVNFPTTQ